MGHDDEDDQGEQEDDVDEEQDGVFVERGLDATACVLEELAGGAEVQVGLLGEDDLLSGLEAVGDLVLL